MITVNQACIDLIKEFEGLMLKAYHGADDPPNVFTIGYGIIKYPPTYLNGKNVAIEDDPITEEQSESFLRFYVNQKANLIDNFLRDDLSGNQFGALISFAYNLGEGALRYSTLLKKVNANPMDVTIRDEFNKWVHSNGKVIEGLKRRRSAEADLYFTT